MAYDLEILIQYLSSAFSDANKGFVAYCMDQTVCHDPEESTATACLINDFNIMIITLGGSAYANYECH